MAKPTKAALEVELEAQRKEAAKELEILKKKEDLSERNRQLRAQVGESKAAAQAKIDAEIKKRVNAELERRNPHIGFFQRQDERMKQALIEVAHKDRAASRVTAAADMQEQNEYKRKKRAENLVMLLNSTVERYTNGLELYTAWKAHGARDMAAVERALAMESSEAGKLKFLRNEIEMRVIGLGWAQFETRWSSSPDDKIGTVDYLKALLAAILTHEIAERRLKNLPTEAAPPPLRMRTLKELGTPSMDAEEIAGRALFNVDELEEKANAARLPREAAGISDSVEDAQPADAPEWGDLVDKKIEVCWPYHLENGSRQLIWSPGRVVLVADGKSHKRTQRCKHILPVGAVLWEWEADDAFGESAGQQWIVLAPEKWNRQTAMSWRYDPSELAGLARDEGANEPPALRRRTG